MERKTGTLLAKHKSDSKGAPIKRRSASVVSKTHLLWLCSCSHARFSCWCALRLWSPSKPLLLTSVLTLTLSSTLTKLMWSPSQPLLSPPGNWPGLAQVLLTGEQGKALAKALFAKLPSLFRSQLDPGPSTSWVASPPLGSRSLSLTLALALALSLKPGAGPTLPLSDPLS